MFRAAPWKELRFSDAASSKEYISGVKLYHRFGQEAFARAQEIWRKCNHAHKPNVATGCATLLGDRLARATLVSVMESADLRNLCVLLRGHRDTHIELG